MWSRIKKNGKATQNFNESIKKLKDLKEDDIDVFFPDIINSERNLNLQQSNIDQTITNGIYIIINKILLVI